MRIGLQTWGTEGDIRPFIALAAGLVRRGHEVSLAVTEIMNGDYSFYGEKFGFQVSHPGRLNLSRREFTALGRRFVSSSSPVLKSRLLVENFLNPCRDEMYETALELCGSCDAVVGHLFAYPLRAAALKTGVPWASLYTTPVIPSSTVAAPGFPDVFRRTGWRCFGLALNAFWRPDIEVFFRARDLPGPESVFGSVFCSELLNIVAVSPSLYPGGGIPGYRFCGAMEIPLDNGAGFPDDLREFIDAGPPPVFATFGSMLHGEEREEDLVDILVEAADIAGCRAVIQARGTGSPEGVFFTGRVPHSLVFPRCSAVVHHGGCGTSHAACAAGVPSVVVEYTSDQPMWGRILKKAGVSPGTLHRRSLTSAALASAMGTALREPVWASNASSMAEAMRNENGVETAVGLIENTFGGRK